MVDVAVNNMGVSGPEQKVDFSQYVPFNDPKYFHSFCNIMNYGNQTEVENCWLAGLPDLRTEDADVRNVWYPWVKDLVANYSIDGLRVDALKHVKKDFWADFEKSSGVYNFGECYDGDASYTCAYQQVMSGVANYPLLNQIVATFNNTSTDFSPLIDEMKAISSSCKVSP